MTCEHCNGPGGRESGHCCWALGMKIREFKRRVFRIYILEALFDSIVSLASVIIDIVILVYYFVHGKWLLAVLTALPVLLPTLVFTNVYMTDVSRGYCKLPKDRRKRQQQRQRERERQEREGDKNRTFSFMDQLEQRSHGTILGPPNCFACCSGIFHSIFHKDHRIRSRGAKVVRKAVRRYAKYFFGTLVLRFIAWIWYLKAFVFGIKAYRHPKKYLNVEQPDTHWSRDLLVRLDFFQSALENAPQCIIQLYALLTDADENVALGLLALCLSFVDFIRVSTTVLWNIKMGPVEAQENCYGTLIWQLMNVCSWIFLYVARCSAIGLIIGTVFSGNEVIMIVPIVIAIVHCTIFATLVSRLKIGQASEKLAVTTFISIFFLPELDSRDVHVMIQFYYAMTLLENTLFIIPWSWDLNFSAFCFGGGHKPPNPPPPPPPLSSTPYPVITTTTEPDYFDETSTDGLFESLLGSKTVGGVASDDSPCLMDPVILVVVIPCLTIVGIVFRLAAAKRMSQFKASQPPTVEEKSFTMEERVANIYNHKWTKMTLREMWRRFMRMLFKEALRPESTTSHTKGIHEMVNNLKTKDADNYEYYQDGGGGNGDDQKLRLVTHEYESHVSRQSKTRMGTPVRKSCSEICLSKYFDFDDDNTRANYEHTNSSFGKDVVQNDKISWTPGNENMMMKMTMMEDPCTNFRRNSVPHGICFVSNHNGDRPYFTDVSSAAPIRNLDVRFLRVEVDSGVHHVFETIHI